MQKNKLPCRARSVLAGLALAGVLSACMSPATKLHRDPEDWQSAEFVGLVDDHAVNVSLMSDCRTQREATPAERDNFALIRQRNHEGKFVQTQRYWIVAAGRQAQLKGGDVVYFNTRDCQAPLAPTQEVLKRRSQYVAD